MDRVQEIKYTVWCRTYLKHMNTATTESAIRKADDVLKIMIESIRESGTCIEMDKIIPEKVSF